MPLLRVNPLVQNLRSSAIRDLLALTRRPGVLSLAGGLPAAETFPAAELAEVVARVLAEHPAEALQYGPTEGHEPLRAWIAGYEGRRSGRPVDPSRVVVTAGSQQALDLLGRTLGGPGAQVVVEEPGYLGALQAWSAAGTTLVPVPTDAHGLDVEVLAGRLAAGLRPVAVYSVTTFHNPRGVTLSEARRRRLAGLADRYGFLVVEDDPYAEIRFGGDPVPPVRAFTDRAVTLGSFSKTVAPGLRVGWCVLPEPLVAPVVRLKQTADLHAGSLVQAAVTALVTDDRWWAGHLAAIRPVYAGRAAALARALADAFGDRLELNAPQGGMFLWGRFTDGTSTAELLRAALEQGVAFVPGAEFFTVDGGDDALRLSFATNAPAQLIEAARRLAAAHATLPATVTPAAATTATAAAVVAAAAARAVPVAAGRPPAGPRR